MAWIVVVRLILFSDAWFYFFFEFVTDSRLSNVRDENFLSFMFLMSTHFIQSLVVTKM